MIAQIQNTFALLETFEKGLNVIGYVPVIGTIGSKVREIYSIVESVAAVVFAAIATGLYIQGQACRSYFVIAGTLLGHSILNEIRSYFEAQPFISLMTTLPYDIVTKLYFGKRVFSYL